MATFGANNPFARRTGESSSDHHPKSSPSASSSSAYASFLADEPSPKVELVVPPNSHHTDQYEDLSAPRSASESFFSIWTTPTHMILDDARHPEDQPLVIEKLDGHSGRFIDISLAPSTEGAYYTEALLIVGIVVIEACSYLVLVTGHELVGEIEGHPIYRVTKTKFLSFKPTSLWIKIEKDQKPPYHEVQKFINSGLFYYSFDYHLTHSLERQHKLEHQLENKPMWECADRRYFWNYHLLRHFIKAKLHDWVVPVMRGYAHIEKLFLPSTHEKIDFVIFSRNSCMRAGTRYNSRGVNDDGNVANYVETEQIIFLKDNQISLILLRGSVPLFWEQKIIKGKYQPELTRTKEATVFAFNKHISAIVSEFHKLHVVDLLDGKKREGMISQAYNDQVILSPHMKVGALHYVHWDFHAECGNSRYENISRLVPMVEENISSFGYFRRDPTGTVVSLQKGVFRVNCLDCLDRTNVILGTIAKLSLYEQLKGLGVGDYKFSDFSRLAQGLKESWANNGDAISRGYTGTGAMKSNFTRTGKRTIGGMVDDGKKSITRMYINNFKDDEKQEAIDHFLGNIEEDIPESAQPADDRWVASQLKHRQSEFTTAGKAKIFIGTWNTNGHVPSPTTNLDPWISVENHDDVAIYVFGFQEIVKLTTGSIVNADEANMNFWAYFLQGFLNSRRTKTKVALAGSVQLVGLAILVFIREDQLEDLRGFQISKSKTAARGVAGNKGALCARFDFKDTSIVCVCGHLEAGQKHFEQRIKNVAGISQKTRFFAHHTPNIESHDYQFWFGDFNFRIDLPRDEVIRLAKANEIKELLLYDQLLKACAADMVFSGFVEGEITFIPTYKFDVGTNNFDSSEKKRIPAWCDRILSTSAPELKIGLISYTAGHDLTTSDHKPVKGLFEIDIKVINHPKKKVIENELKGIVQTLTQEQQNQYAVPYNYKPKEIPLYHDVMALKSTKYLPGKSRPAPPPKSHDLPIPSSSPNLSPVSAGSPPLPAHSGTPPLPSHHNSGPPPLPAHHNSNPQIAVSQPSSPPVLPPPNQQLTSPNQFNPFNRSTPSTPSQGSPVNSNYMITPPPNNNRTSGTFAPPLPPTSSRTSGTYSALSPPTTNRSPTSSSRSSGSGYTPMSDLSDTAASSSLHSSGSYSFSTPPPSTTLRSGVDSNGQARGGRPLPSSGSGQQFVSIVQPLPVLNSAPPSVVVQQTPQAPPRGRPLPSADSPVAPPRRVSQAPATNPFGTPK